MLTAEVAAFLASGVGLLVATADEDGMPHATRAWAADVVDADRGIVRLVVPGDDPRLADQLEVGDRVACTGADVRTLEAVQVKGRVTAVRPPGDDDLDRAARHAASLFEAIHAMDGNPLELLERLLPTSYLVCELEAEEVFDQTPGPRAGARVEGS